MIDIYNVLKANKNNNISFTINDKKYKGTVLEVFSNFFKARTDAVNNFCDTFYFKDITMINETTFNRIFIHKKSQQPEKDIIDSSLNKIYKALKIELIRNDNREDFDYQDEMTIADSIDLLMDKRYKT